MDSRPIWINCWNNIDTIIIIIWRKLIKDKSAEKIRFLERKQKLRENGAKRQG